jgi:hypothetical protein
MRRQDKRPPPPVGAPEVITRTYILTPLGATTEPIDPDRFVEFFASAPRNAFASYPSLRLYARDEVAAGDLFIAGYISFDSSKLRYIRIAPLASYDMIDAFLADHADLDGAVYAGAHGDRIRLRPSLRLVAGIREIRRHRLPPRSTPGLPERIALATHIQARIDEIRRKLDARVPGASDEELESIASAYPTEATQPEHYIRALAETRSARSPAHQPSSSFRWGDPFSQGGGYFGGSYPKRTFRRAKAVEPGTASFAQSL